MAENLTSEGKCVYCNEVFSQKEITKHLTGHLKKLEKDNEEANTENFCHIEVEAGEMFLHLLVKGSAKMKDIDTFLRKIWLDCCGHMSGFSHKRAKVSMSHAVENVFAPKVKIQHDYDYGTTTTVFLKGHKKYELEGKDKIVLLSRNEPLKIMCSICNAKPASCLCTVCLWEESSFFCESCTEKHEEICEDFSDYANAPIVNSPRMGECGYDGGVIDKDRDGCFAN